MRHFLTFSFSFLCLLLATSGTAMAAFPVGNGFSCSGKSSVITKGKKVVSYKAAKAEINKQLNPAVKKLDSLRDSNASEAEISAQQDIVNQLSQVLGSVARCSRGQLPRYEDPYWNELQSYFWVGTYTLLPYNITDELQMGFGNDFKTMDGFFAVANLGDTPVGILGLLDYKANIKGVTPTLKANSTFKSIESELGKMTFTITKQKTFKIDIVDVPASPLGLTHIVITAQRTDNTIAGTADLRAAGDASVATINFSATLDK